MSNSSNVRFESTYFDLIACQQSLIVQEELSESEERYKLLLVSLCIDIQQDHEGELLSITL